MRYYKVTDESGNLLSIGTVNDDEPIDGEITYGEYSALMQDILEKSEIVYMVSNGSMSIDDVRQEWQAEIAGRVAARNAEADTEIPDEDVLTELLGVLNGEA